MDRVQSELYELCNDFLILLDTLRKAGKISETEYEQHIKLKKLFIHQRRSELST